MVQRLSWPRGGWTIALLSFRGASLAVLLCVVTAGLLLPGPAIAQTRFTPGDRVHCDWLQNGRYELATVVPFTSTDLDQSGRWYRVRLDMDKIPNATVECMLDRLRAVPLATVGTPAFTDPPHSLAATLPATTAAAASADVRQAEPRPAPMEPPVAPAAPVLSGEPAVAGGPIPSLAGTAWKIDYGRGQTGDVFLFCSSGTWQIIPARGSIGAVGRSYSVSGTTLTTVDRDDGKVQTWQMSGDNSMMIIDDGRQALSLHYNGTTRCH